MEQDALRRLLLERVVEHSVRSIRSDPERALRKLVDLGRDVAAGPGQKQFLGQVQQVLARRDCPYYRLARDLIAAVDPARLKTCGINLGWNGLTVGVRQIRAREAQLGRHIPWSLTLRLSGDPSFAPVCARRLAEGRELGIRAYFLFPQAQPGAVELALDLARSAPDCVFFLFLPPGTPADASLRQGPENLVLGLETTAPGWAEEARRLREDGCLYLLYRVYATAEDGADIRSGRWADRLLSHGGLAAVGVSAPHCPPAVARQVGRYVRQARMRPRAPILPADFYPDNLYADACVSSGPCVLVLGPESEDLPLERLLPPLPPAESR